ncbi:cytochrome P450 [Tellurirhabdus rosea]|uniref:cytochrome P450 n=1 Tax=Tellurirhabdus rosea TaxID=2674997 RepID=UPI00225720F1|nr:cytochrome P450 [Tellurirhabdus rosea]
MKPMPRIGLTESLSAFLSDGYRFIQKCCRIYETDIFGINLPGKPVFCIHGREAARLFYDPSKFIRHGAVPAPIQKTLTGEKAIHTLDNGQHRHRKDMFRSLLMAPDRIQTLMEAMRQEWIRARERWSRMPRVVLFEESQTLLTLAACRWAGIPLTDEEAPQRARDMWSMVDGFGSLGVRNWKGRAARQRTERWIGALIEQVRAGTLPVEEGTPLAVLARFTEPDASGSPQVLDPKMAAVELLNATRPIVAISTYIVFAAHALHRYRGFRQQLRTAGTEADIERFVQEVRRYYPFAPFMGARVRDDFDWQGHRFPKGTLVLLDIFGTNRDARLWQRPEEFWPERFRNWDGDPFRLIPQGGGPYENGHRCPGEWITIEALKVAVGFLTQSMTFDVPKQDMDYPITRLPTFPKSGFVMINVRQALTPVTTGPPVSTGPPVVPAAG